MLVNPDHVLIIHTPDRLSIRDAQPDADGNIVEHASARREGGVWTVSAEGQPDVETIELHEHKGGVIGKLTEHALLKAKGTLAAEGFVTHIPDAARKLHGEDEFEWYKNHHKLHHLKF